MNKHVHTRNTDANLIKNVDRRLKNRLRCNFFFYWKTMKIHFYFFQPSSILSLSEIYVKHVCKDVVWEKYHSCHSAVPGFETSLKIQIYLSGSNLKSKSNQLLKRTHNVFPNFFTTFLLLGTKFMRPDWQHYPIYIFNNCFPRKYLTAKQLPISYKAFQTK